MYYMYIVNIIITRSIMSYVLLAPLLEVFQTPDARTRSLESRPASLCPCADVRGVGVRVCAMYACMRARTWMFCVMHAYDHAWRYV